MLPVTQRQRKPSLLLTVLSGLYSSAFVGLPLSIRFFFCVGVVFWLALLLFLSFIGQIFDFLWGKLKLISQEMGVVLFWVFVLDFLRVVALGGRVIVSLFIRHWGNIPAVVMIRGNMVVSKVLVVVPLGLLVLSFDLAQL